MGNSDLHLKTSGFPLVLIAAAIFSHFDAGSACSSLYAKVLHGVRQEVYPRDSCGELFGGTRICIPRAFEKRCVHCAMVRWIQCKACRRHTQEEGGEAMLAGFRAAI